jgi:hypothetical protein
VGKYPDCSFDDQLETTTLMMNVYHNDWIDHYLFDLMMVKMNIPHHDDTEILVKYAMDDFH